MFATLACLGLIGAPRCAWAEHQPPSPPPPMPVMFNQSFGSYMVLQRAPEQSAVYGE